ncbi:MAG: translation initiation factor IF-5A [Methanomassiliicoccaceae archaeon]|jgi:translation initiation factor 5A|nr:translation initiation factor IF-5A [Methanomassiliicoccaceae archaeon]
MWEQKEVRELKIGRYLNIDGEPCKIISMTTSKPGKHGAAKANIEATSIFTGAKKSIISPVNAKVQVPMIDKRKGQILSLRGDEIQLMDLETFETFTMAINDDHESALVEGGEVMYIVAMGRQRLM